MNDNLFWPIYKKIEEEFKDLSYYIAINKKQLKTYSIKIADLILRTVSECENIASTICKRENIKFKDKKGHIRKTVYFNEYIEQLNAIFKLEQKNVSIKYINIDNNTFDSKLTPFQKEILKINGKQKSILPWYNAYNKIKHDRVKNFKQANLENLINSLAALFMLNIYLKNQIFYTIDNYDYKNITKKIENFSDVFEIDYSIKTNRYDHLYNKNDDSFFDPISYFEVGLPMSVYVLECDKEIKTDTDKFSDGLNKLESKVMILSPDGTLTPKYANYPLTDHKTVCKIVASINRY
ncbi:hypothetical protein [Clostridium saccharobutylicum]|uniref:Uncharacterized protein n=1 Tax=Clostridium saccharobutylicum TaxID=169679 RepID=A0A1S8MYS6_CLOSA|nr:hypothetical protein [Clostridium saccharobutylicum]OOM09320.1 hypothetical protein CLOSAC_36010 [Clostridium saccharobutylicum]